MNATGTRPRTLALVLTALLGSTPIFGARQTQPPAATPAKQTPQFEDTARVVAVEVPVNVVDKDGRPVRGLTANDFEVFDEGKAQAITDFETIDLASATFNQDSRPEDLSPAARRHFLLLFDVSFSSPSNIHKARLAAREVMLQQMHPTDLVAVAIYSLETGPRLVVTFTPDRAQVAQAIDSLGTTRSKEIDPLRFLIVPTGQPGQDATSTRNESRTELSEASGAAREHFIVMAEQLEKNERGFKSSEITNFSRSLSEMARILSNLEGRKQVVLFSEGFDSRLFTGDPIVTANVADQRDLLIQRGDITRLDSDEVYGSTSIQTRLREMVSEFRRADCVIQAVDIGGLRAGNDTRQAASVRTGEESLFYMAHETGGELFKDGNNLAQQLEDVLERTSVTYVLTYTPPNPKQPGEFRRLRVRLKNDALSNVRLAHRAGYYAARPFAELDPRERDLLAAQAIATAKAASDFEINVLVATFRATPSWAYVPVIIEVDGETLLRAHTAAALPLEIYGYVTDKEGRVRGFFTQEITLDVGKGRQALEAKGIKYYGHLELAPGEYLVRVLVRNTANGRTAVRAIPLAVPAFESQQAYVLPPFFHDQPGQWLLVRERSGGSSSQSTVYPFTVNGEVYVPAAHAELGPAGDARLCVVAYNLGDGPVTLSGRVVTAAGEVVPGGKIEMVERTTTGIAGYDKILARFEARDLEAGSYVLKVDLTEPVSGRSESSSIGFSVVR